MTKVRMSQIPEDSPIIKKTKRTSKKEGWRTIDPDEESSEVDNYFDSIDSGSNEEDQKTYFRTMLNIPDAGIVLNAFQVNSIEKTFRLLESNYGGDNVTPQYGIAINRGLVASPSCPKTDIEIWFYKEEIRDQRYDKMLAALDDAGIKLMNV